MEEISKLRKVPCVVCIGISWDISDSKFFILESDKQIQSIEQNQGQETGSSQAICLQAIDLLGQKI